MRDIIFQLKPSAPISLQAQIRQNMVSAICAGQLSAGERIPSSRRLADLLNVSRNTVSLAYQRLLDDGFLEVRERSGYYVAGDFPTPPTPVLPTIPSPATDWSRQMRIRPSAQTNIVKPRNWRDYQYPFIYGQVDHALFPIAEWRDCVRQALGRKWLESWTSDAVEHDDPMLVEQVRKRLLPARGILADEDQILITLGAQHALYMCSSLLVSERTTVAIENPGYPDLRNIFRLRTDRIIPATIDGEGLVVDDRLSLAQLICTTPSHQAPTNVTMSVERREQLLAVAAASNALIVEDDYESETNFVGAAVPALKAGDADGRVIYIGSLSKTLFPGLRLGYVVASADIIRELRALRRLMVRHPPSNNQRAAALFLALGHHDALVIRLRRAYKERWLRLRQAFAVQPAPIGALSLGGSSAWVQGPRDLDATKLAATALTKGLIIEPGDVYFMEQPPPRRYYRLGFSSIDTDRIAPGIALLATLVHQALS
ncbi:MAG: PLP-dependent aminotransferase family protein [Rhodospirillaceae bacterium]|nr:PLP-dependent aminotransferase family protein [Rhodospirillaceae bacterium]